MNKLMGFLELKELDLPSVPWREYTGKEVFDTEKLWTIRSAVYRGADLNLPRLVGAGANEAQCFADRLLKAMGDKGIVVFYPYFFANKSGNLLVYNEKIIIEAVEKDLWNLVTLSKRNVTIEVINEEVIYNGDEFFLTKAEMEKLISNIHHIKQKFRGDILEGNGVLLEWSFAQDSNLNNNPIGEEYLVFYEVRTIN